MHIKRSIPGNRVNWQIRGWGLVALLIGLFAINFIIQISFMPTFASLGTDSGTFAYCGGRMVAGDVLYRDCWDNKPPLVYSINALIVLVGGHNPWAIWWFQLLWMAAATAVIFLVALRVWENRFAAGWSTLLFLGTALTPYYYSNGNLTETYLLLPLGLTAGAFYAYLTSGQRRWMLAAGLLTAAATLLKPTYLGLGAAVVLTTLLFNWRRQALKKGFGDAVVFALGFALPWGGIAAAWGAMGAMKDLMFAVFQHNTGYVQSGLSLASIRGTIKQLIIVQPLAGLLWLALIAAILFVGMRLNQWHQSAIRWLPVEDTRAWWVLGLLIALPVQMVSIGISGKNFGHYFLEVIPVLALIAGGGLAVFFSEKLQMKHFPPVFIVTGFVSLAILGLWGNGVITKGLVEPKRIFQFAQAPNEWDYQPGKLERYILDHSRSDESVLMWAAHVDRNFVTNRRSPTRYIFPLHLLTPTLTGDTGFPELLGELKADPPRLIILQVPSSAGLPSFADTGKQLCPDCTDEVRQGMETLHDYIFENYHPSQKIYDWQIYERN